MCRPSLSLRLCAVIGASLTAVTLTACGNSGSSGGSPNTGQIDDGHSGGVTGSGGATGSGGTTGSGGVRGSGGTTGSDGAAGSGGQSAGSGGVAASGGNRGSGGAPGSGGASTTGSGGAPPTGGVTGTGSTSSGGTIGGGGAIGTAGSLGHGGMASGGATGAGGAPATCAPGTKLTGGKQYCSNSKGSSNGGYAYELWSDGTGSGCMTVYGTGAAFSATWTKAGDFLARVGLAFDQTKTPTQLGTISSDFAETKTNDDGLVYVGIYGWTVSPLREYYIIDDWGTTKPAGTASDGMPRTHVGTITVDGDTYDVWKRTKTNAPAITGDNQTFDQYFSVRQNARQCGHISISEHFAQWTSLGLQLGKLEEAKLLLEAQSSTGTIDFTTATVVVK